MLKQNFESQKMKHLAIKIFITLLFLAIVVCLISSCNQSKKSDKEKQPHQTIFHKPWPEQTQLPIWTTSIPDSDLIKGTETYKDGMLFNVSKPTITVYQPQNGNSGAAVIVFPGGGYNKLAVELEGSEICEWLASIGVTGILLKYRVPASGASL